MKQWIVNVHYSACTEDTYGAYAEENPINAIYDNSDLWWELVDTNFNNFARIDDGPEREEFDSEEEYEEAYEDWYDEYVNDVSIDCEEYSDDDFESFEIIYDERNI